MSLRARAPADVRALAKPLDLSALAVRFSFCSL